MMWGTLATLVVLVAAAAARPSNAYWGLVYQPLYVGQLPMSFGSQHAGSRSDAAGVCGLPIEKGPCKAAIPAWAFVGGACREFVYGGCQGNSNNFETLAECQAACGGDARYGRGY